MGSPNVPNVGTTSGSVNDVFNRAQNKYLSQYDQPFLFNTSLTYTVPSLRTNKILSWAARDWTVGAFLAYSSGLPILAPAANNALASCSSAVPSPIACGRTTVYAGPQLPLLRSQQEFVLNPKPGRIQHKANGAPVRHTIATTGSNAVPRKTWLWAGPSVFANR